MKKQYFLLFDIDGLCVASYQRLTRTVMETDKDGNETPVEKVMREPVMPKGVMAFDDESLAMRLVTKKSRWVDGKEIEYTLAEKHAAQVARMDYAAKRRAAYPSIGDQLDMIYKDKLNGTTTFEDAITTVKTTIPKA